TAFQSDERCDLAAAMDAHDIVRGARELERLRIHFVEAVYDIDLRENRAHCIRAFECCRNVDRPELRAEPALPQPRDVGVQWRRELALILPEIDLREMILHALLVLVWKIVVPVDKRHFAKDAIDARGNCV